MILKIKADSVNREDMQMLVSYIADLLANNDLWDIDNQIIDNAFGTVTFELNDD